MSSRVKLAFSHLFSCESNSRNGKCHKVCKSVTLFKFIHGCPIQSFATIGQFGLVCFMRNSPSLFHLLNVFRVRNEPYEQYSHSGVHEYNNSYQNGPAIALNTPSVCGRHLLTEDVIWPVHLTVEALYTKMTKSIEKTVNWQGDRFAGMSLNRK